MLPHLYKRRRAAQGGSVVASGRGAPRGQHPCSRLPTAQLGASGSHEQQVRASVAVAERVGHAAGGRRNKQGARSPGTCELGTPSFSAYAHERREMAVSHAPSWVTFLRGWKKGVNATTRELRV